MIGRERLMELKGAAPGFFKRQVKTAKQARFGWFHEKRVAFVFGAQRSGTKMLMRILDNSPATRIYHENHATAFTDFQLRPDPVLRTLVALNPAPSQIFKPICNSQEADQILDRWPQARGLWIFRHVDDVANSATVKWGEHQVEVVAAVAAGNTDTWGWRTARIPSEVRANIRRVYRPDLSVSEGAMLFWYLRNAFFFALGLDRHPRMKLVRYEDLVKDPVRSFPAVFDFVGARFDPSYLERVRATSVGRREPPASSPEIRELCLGLLAKLEAWAPAPEPVPSPVLLLINTLGVGGAERYVVTVANALAEAGSQVSVASNGGDLVAELHPSVRHHALALTRVRSDLPRAGAALRKVIAAERPAVIVANSLAVTWVARAADPRGRIPLVNVGHGWPQGSYAAVGPLMRVADRVVAVSPEVKQRLVAAGTDAERVEVVFNGVDCRHLGRRQGAQYEAARAAMHAAPGDVVVVVVGRLAPQKAHHHVIAVAERLRAEHPNLRFVLVGEGERAVELGELAVSRGVADRVHMLGLRHDVAELLGAADIYLSTSDWEGMSLTLIEAMASGLPVVSTRTEGSAHVVTENTGLLVPVGDVAALAGAVAELAGDPARRAALAEAGRARALGTFSHERMVGDLRRVLRSVIGRG